MKLKSIAALYMASPEWYGLAEGSRRVYVKAMDQLGDLLEMEANKITRPMIIDLRDRLYHKSATCRSVLAVLNNILRYGYDRGLCMYNHAGSVRHQPKATPIPRWGDDECQRFLESTPTYLRRAFLLALFTGQRRIDLVRMKWDQYDGTHITVMQKKTKRVLKLPVHPILKAELDAAKAEEPRITKGGTRVKSPYILLNFHGDPWTAVSLTQAIKQHCKKVGITGRCLHGLRKTTAAKLAELGCTPHLIGAVTGHASLRELQNYTREADQVRMAEEAMGRWTT